jgi:type VI secretion system protein ImpH
VNAPPSRTGSAAPARGGAAALPPGALEEPWRFDVLDLLRRLERGSPDKPRIGHSAALREEIVRLGQQIYLDFPASTVAEIRRDASGVPLVLVRFLGLLGPQGALPLATTEEANGWVQAQDESFVRFLDLFEHRFLQLFFRAWADARPAAQHDRPREDRFAAYLGSGIGLGSPVLQGLDSVPDRSKLAFAGLLGASARSPVRLRAFLEGLFGVTVEIEEFHGTRLALEPADRTRLGQRHAVLGVDALAGASLYSVEDSLRVRVQAPDLAAYERFLPTGDRSDPLEDALFFVLGHEIGWSRELALPARAAAPARLGRFGRLGWTTWLSPGQAAPDAVRADARLRDPKRHRLRKPAPPAAPDHGRPRPASPGPKGQRT